MNNEEMREAVIEFVRRLSNIENEMSELRERKKDLTTEFKTKFDLPTLRLALTVAKAKSNVKHAWEFDSMLEVLEKEFAVLP